MNVESGDYQGINGNARKRVCGAHKQVRTKRRR
jgi:hypothetical protein